MPPPQTRRADLFQFSTPQARSIREEQLLPIAIHFRYYQVGFFAMVKLKQHP
jgi:hypothetical protein